MNWKLYFWLDRSSRWLLAGVMLAGGAPKLLAPASFSKVIEAYGLLPGFLNLPAAIALPVLELTAAFLLIRNRSSGLWLTALLLLLFVTVLSYGISLGLDIDCGCFGPEDVEHLAFSSLRSALVRDVLLSIPVVYCFVYANRIHPSLCGEK